MNDSSFILKVVEAIYVDGLTLRLIFNDGAVRLCDFTPMSQRGICTKLQDPAYFRNFRLDPFTIDWNNEIGFAPEYLYEHSEATSPASVTEPESSHPAENYKITTSLADAKPASGDFRKCY